MFAKFIILTQSIISASLKTACPSGVYVALTPADATQWHAVLFVRNGVYAPAILRFRITFPNAYPVSPPVIVFETDIFHPLLVPLTTYSYVSNPTESSGKDSDARDELLLPPGGFSLHGMRSEGERRLGDGGTGPRETDIINTSNASDPLRDGKHRNSSNASSSQTVQILHASQSFDDSQRYLAAEVLYYVKLAFSSHEFLDKILLVDAVNPGAFFAWRSHRLSTAPDLYNERQEQAKKAFSSQLSAGSRASKEDSPNTWPGQWNWDGVWKDRVQKAVQASVAGSTLFGDVNNDDVVSVHCCGMILSRSL